ncbi:MAG: hypothetical protein ACR2RF_30215 [Geminicoccaceae bacterium]
MPTLSNDELKRQVEAVFGTTLTDAEIEAGKGRLPTMVDNARLLAGWAGRFGTMGPAQVLQVTEASGQKAGADD